MQGNCRCLIEDRNCKGLVLAFLRPTHEKQAAPTQAHTQNPSLLVLKCTAEQA